jgi:hypothetical protein
MLMQVIAFMVVLVAALGIAEVEFRLWRRKITRKLEAESRSMEAWRRGFLQEVEARYERQRVSLQRYRESHSEPTVPGLGAQR